MSTYSSNSRLMAVLITLACLLASVVIAVAILFSNAGLGVFLLAVSQVAYQFVTCFASVTLWQQSPKSLQEGSHSL